MKPFRIFIFLVTVALYLVLLALIFPRQGISITSDIHLKFLDLRELGKSGSDKEEVVERLLATASVSEDPEADFDLPVPGLSLAEEPGQGVEEEVVNLPVEEAGADTLPYVAPANADSLKGALRPLEFEGGQRSVLHPFFQKLDALSTGKLKQSRIMHFGDSQIENDRMTALIRYRLQRQFGGSGAGLVQAIPLYGGSLAFRQETEGEWQRYTFFGNRDSTITHRVYGPMGAFAAVPAPGKEVEAEGWPTLDYRFNQGRRTGRFDRIKIFMHSYVEGGRLAFTLNDSLSDTVQNVPSGFSVAGYGSQEDISQLHLSMDLPEGGRIYGISFESASGLQMDNIAMRGGSGLIFSKMNREQQLKMMEQLRPGLLILQYGGNVVPYINASRYSWKFRKELEFLKDLCPGIPIIVIGPSDMSYPGVEPVNDALRTAALEAGCGFWDLYSAMGGHNSMPSFVHADPPLASTDYIHFTSLGVNLVAEMFYKAFMNEYAVYLKLKS